jgi:hypothetical protein
MISRSVFTIVVVSSLSILTGCGAGGPSLSESQQAIDKLPGAEMMSMTVKSIDNCEEVRDNVYGCDIEVSSEVVGIKQTKTANIKFKKNNKDEWATLN